MKKSSFLLSVMIILLGCGVQVYSYSITGNSVSNPGQDNLRRIESNSINVTDTSYRMIWIIIDRLSPELVYRADTPNIDILQRKGAFGLMNVRTAGHLNSESTYLSANAGNRCQGSKMSHNAIGYGKGAKNTEINQLLALNKQLNYQANPGLLGDLARRNETIIGVLGNSDHRYQERRTIVSMTMDSSGYVPYAEIDKDILQTVQKPWGYQTDYSKLREKFIEYQNKVDALFIDTGDISRIDFFENSLLSDKNPLLEHQLDFEQEVIVHRQEKVDEQQTKLDYPQHQLDFQQNQLDYQLDYQQNQLDYQLDFQQNQLDYQLDYQQEILDFQQEKIAALERIDSFVGFVLNHINLNKTQLALIVPTPSEKAIVRGERLSWVLFAGNGIEKGWLSSASTRRRGLITISDLLPTFLAANLAANLNDTCSDIQSGIEKGDYQVEVNANKKVNHQVEVNGNRESNYNVELKGSPIYSIITSDGPEWRNLIALNRWISFIYNIRPPFIQTFILLQIIIIMMAISSTIWKNINKIYIFQHLFEYLLLAILLVPINFMILSIFQIVSIGINLLILLFLLLVEEYVLLNYIKKPFDRVMYIAISLVLLICLNLLDSYIMLADSILGYSSIIGARYYGIGNEYMGFFLGAFLIFLVIFLEKLHNKDLVSRRVPLYILITFLLSTYLIGAGNLGSNFGGMITALITGGITTYYIFDTKKLSNKSFYKFLIITLSAVFIFAILFVDYSRILGERSHIGRAVQRLLNQDWDWLANTIFRKFSMNLKLLRWTIWTRVLLFMIIYLFILLKKPVPSLKRLFENNHFIKAGLYGILAGCLVTMFVNDSGVVAAATLLFYPVMSLLYFLK